MGGRVALADTDFAMRLQNSLHETIDEILRLLATKEVSSERLSSLQMENKRLGP